MKIISVEADIREKGETSYQDFCGTANNY